MPRTTSPPRQLADQPPKAPSSLAGGARGAGVRSGRLFLTDLCWSKSLACGGDTRLQHWEERATGSSSPSHFTARNGSTMAGHVWATRRVRRKRPLVVITNGSVQASEELYWWAAQTLAKAGYVVLTRDPQMQGRSDTFGDGEDALDGFPSQTTGHLLRPHPGRDRLRALPAGRALLPAPEPVRDQPLRQAAGPGRRRPGHGVQPALAAGGPHPDRPRRTLLRRRRGQLGRPARPPGRRGGRLGQPLRPDRTHPQRRPTAPRGHRRSVPPAWRAASARRSCASRRWACPPTTC